jgi:predicted phosphodiesterase
MRVHVLSDLHLGRGAMERPRTDADIVVLAGDLARPQAAAAWSSGFDKPVLYVLGNHEFYGGSIDGTISEFRRLVTGSQVRLLEENEVVVEGVRFLGTTLWTDFRLLGEGAEQTAAIDMASRLLRDFSRIRAREADAALFTPQDAAERFARHAAWLDARLAEPHDGPTVVITHHAPSPRSIHPRFAGSLLNPCFVSDAEHLIGAERAQLWIHGHTHDSFDYRVNGTRVVCNPRGYAKNGVNENALFDPGFTVEVC